MRTIGVVSVFVAVMLSSLSAVSAADFVVSSPQVTEGEVMRTEQVYKGFGCEGANVSPALNWQNPPEGTRSFAVTVYDPDAPTGSGWWHWVIYNIPATETGLRRNAGDPEADIAPTGSVQSRTDYNHVGYGGPCPPEGHGEHHYVFSIYALDVERLDLAPDTPAAMVSFNLNNHALGKATLTGLYSR